MKLTTFILMIALAQVSAKGFGQKITLKVTNTPIEQVLQSIREQSGFEFIYNVKDLKGQRVTISLTKATVEDAVQASIQSLALEYTIRQNNIVLTKKAPSFLDKAKSVILNLVQDLDARGRILDESGKPLEGATVVLKGTNRTAKTDVKGEFVMANVPDDGILVIRYVGYKQLEISLKDAVMPLEIRLNLATGELEEVNVTYSTGYQNIPKERATGSFSIINNELLNRQVSTGILDRLKGNAVGLAFNKKDAFGVDEISVRGRSTIFSNADPLIVVDNFPYEGSIDNINPNDVESVTILKDAAAASIWGTRAGNGVIVIKTKNGAYNTKARIDFNANVSIADKPDLFYVPGMSSSEIIDMEQFLFGKGFYDSSILNTTTFPALSPVVEILLKQRNGQITDDAGSQQINELRDNDNRNDLLKYSYWRFRQ